MPEGRGSDARRLDLTKDQRDEHIRRYAELLEARAAVEIQVPQTAAPEIGYRQPPPQTKGIPRQIAEETGLSVDTVRRALKPPPVTPKSFRSDQRGTQIAVPPAFLSIPTGPRAGLPCWRQEATACLTAGRRRVRNTTAQSG